MAENSKIEWTDHTFNPWTGCTKVSAACDHCYAESWSKRSGLVEWGPRAPRQHTSRANWQKPRKWNRDAEAAGTRAKVFCASLADIGDNHHSILQSWRDNLSDLVEDTPALDWLFLTKRPQNILMLYPRWTSGLPQNVWLGTTVENQEEADRRIPHLFDVPAKINFLSCEPLLGPVDLTGSGALSVLDWVICGGESGPGARPMHPDWARSLRDQCASAGVPFFFKQWGDYADFTDTTPKPNKPMVTLTPDGQVIGASDPRSGLGAIEENWKERDGAWMCRVGKKAAGRLLDGVEHNGSPTCNGSGRVSNG